MNTKSSITILLILALLGACSPNEPAVESSITEWVPTFTPSPVPMPEPILLAVLEEDANCYYTSNNNVVINLPQYSVVSIVGQNKIGDWLLVKNTDLSYCWIEANSLNIKGDKDSLPLITTSYPPTISTEPTTPAPYATVTPYGDLWVDILTNAFNCECNGIYGMVHIKMYFKNGSPPFNISGQKPVNSDKAEFDVPLGSGELYFLITSSDGLRWEGLVDVPRQCTPTDNCDNAPPTREPITQCNDGRDNDFDQKVDYPEDPGCDDKSDNSEWPFNWP